MLGFIAWFLRIGYWLLAHIDLSVSNY